MDEFDTGFVADLVGRIYEAAVEPSHWLDFVSVLERTSPQSRVTLFGHQDGCPTANLSVSVNFAADDVRDYTSYYAGISPYVARAAAIPTGRAFHFDVLIG